MAFWCYPDDDRLKVVALSSEGLTIAALNLGGMSGQISRHRRAVSDDRNRHLLIQRGEPLGDRELTLNVRWQACDATTCWPPEQVSLRLTVRERAGVE